MCPNGINDWDNFDPAVLNNEKVQLGLSFVAQKLIHFSNKSTLISKC